MSDKPRWESSDPLRPTPPPKAAGNEVDFANITARLEKAGWITDIHFETADGLTLDWTPSGRERIREFKTILQPLFERLENSALPALSIESQLEMMLRARHLLVALQPPTFTDAEIFELVAFVKVFSPD